MHRQYQEILNSWIQWQNEWNQRCTDVPTDASMHHKFDIWWLCTRGGKQWHGARDYHQEGYPQKDYQGWTYILENNAILNHNWFQVYSYVHLIYIFWPWQAYGEIWLQCHPTPRFVKTQLDALQARGETSNDIMVNLFKCYKAITDCQFKQQHCPETQWIQWRKQHYKRTTHEPCQV